MNLQFLTDENGKKVAVVIPIEEYEELMEDLEDIKAIAERRNDERIPFDTILKEFAADGLVPS